MGRLTAQKAYEIAIDAMKLLKDQGIKGAGGMCWEKENCAEKLQQKIDKLGLIRRFIVAWSNRKILTRITDSVICMCMPPGLRGRALRYRRLRFLAVPFWYQTAAETGSR